MADASLPASLLSPKILPAHTAMGRQREHPKWCAIGMTSLLLLVGAPRPWVEEPIGTVPNNPLCSTRLRQA